MRTHLGAAAAERQIALDEAVRRNPLGDHDEAIELMKRYIAMNPATKLVSCEGPVRAFAFFWLGVRKQLLSRL